MDISKMKVVDLKKELKSRGLNTLGSKNELMERLQEALNDDEGGDVLDNDDILDEDAVLADETDEAILEEGNGTGNEDDSALLTPTLNTPKLTGEKMLQKENVSSLPKKITLNRKNPSTVEILPSTLLASTETNQLHLNKQSNSEGSSKEGKTIIKLGSLSAEERAKLRAEKFGVPLPDSLKKAVRAERFGTANSKPPITTHKIDTDEKLLKRQARFGAVSAIELDVKKQKRTEKFGEISKSSTSTGIDDVKRKRAERFGLAKN